jgi:hypothetical protein
VLLTAHVVQQHHAHGLRDNAPILVAVGTITTNAGVNAVLGNIGPLIHLAIGITIDRSPTPQGVHGWLAGGTYVVRRLQASAIG